jgi:hypothetical protein
MTVTRVLLWVLAGAVVVYLVLVLLMTPVHATSGSGEGNIFTTQSP